MFSPSAFSVGRALDTAHKCGQGSEGIVVTGVSDMFTSEVENPVQFFVPKFFYNVETESFRETPKDQSYWPVQQVQPEDYYGEKLKPPPSNGFAVPQDLAELMVLFQVLDRNRKPMNGQATNVNIQWIEVPESVSFLDVVVAKNYGGEQISVCPKGGNSLSGVAAATVKCLLHEEGDCTDRDKTLVHRACVRS